MKDSDIETVLSQRTTRRIDKKLTYTKRNLILANMATFLKHVSLLALVVLCYGQIVAATIDLETRIANLERLALAVESAVASHAHQLSRLNPRVHHLQDGVGQETEKVRRVAEPIVGFDARLPHRIVHLGDQQDIHFWNVETNNGSAYNPTNGRFTCPQNGLYQFATTIPSKLNGTVDCEMVMDNVQVGRLRANHDGFDQASQVLVLECRTEQQVWVRHTSGANDDAILSSTQRQMASFSGHLIALL
ncbi:uncharacterized protein [Argopecten irradians]|uniref:uncharacterized protein n=1 Tax=Argopecten irradians TaxID=31199 RepID=UPI00371D0846